MKCQRKLVSIVFAASMLALGVLPSGAQTRQTPSLFQRVETVRLENAAQVKTVVGSLNSSEIIQVTTPGPQDAAKVTTPGLSNTAEVQTPNFVEDAMKVKTITLKDALGAR